MAWSDAFVRSIPVIPSYIYRSVRSTMYGGNDKEPGPDTKMVGVRRGGFFFLRKRAFWE